MATLIAACCCAAGFFGALARASAAERHQTASSKQRLTPKQKAAIRRQLTREVRRTPTKALTPSFIKRAALVNYTLPMTVRLARSNGSGGYEPSDDQLELAWDDSANPWPLAGGAPAAVQTSFLNGSFTMDAEWGGDASGYGELGAVETLLGGGVAMTASPFTVSEFDPLCGSGPRLVVDPTSPLAITSAGRKHGVMNMFAGNIRGTLALRMTATTVATDGCGGATGTPSTVDNTTAVPMPLRFQGRFKVSPSITADGKLRFGKITVDDAVDPQSATFALLRACSGVVSCDPLAFPTRLKLKKLTADVLLGDVFP